MIARLQRFWRFALRQPAAVQPPVRSSRDVELAQLLRITAGLPEDPRRVVTLHKVYGFAAPDIAARLGLTAHVVEQHLITAALVFSGCIDFSELSPPPACPAQAQPQPQTFKE